MCFVFFCGAQVLVADSDDEVVDHASLLNSFGNDNTNIITPVPRMHSIKPEWDEDVSRWSQTRDRLFEQSLWQASEGPAQRCVSACPRLSSDEFLCVLSRNEIPMYGFAVITSRASN